MPTVLPRRRAFLIVLACATPLLWAGRAAQTQTALPKEKPHPIDAYYDACVAKNGSTHGMIDCAEKAHALWDKQMNTDYQALLKAANPKAKPKIQAAQRAWIAFRDKEWAAQSAFYDRDGTMWGPVRAGLRLRTTKERALQIAGYREDTEPR